MVHSYEGMEGQFRIATGKWGQESVYTYIWEKRIVHDCYILSFFSERAFYYIYTRMGESTLFLECHLIAEISTNASYEHGSRIEVRLVLHICALD